MSTATRGRVSERQELRGPYVAVAAICDRVIMEKDGVASLIRIVDRITERPATPGAAFVPVPWTGTTVISLRAGEGVGDHSVEYELLDPDGVAVFESKSFPIAFAHEWDGVNLFIEQQILLTKTGMYWANVSLDGRPVTRISLQVVFDPLTEDPVDAA